MKKPFLFIALLLVIAIPAAIFLYRKSKEDSEAETADATKGREEKNYG